MVELLLSDTDLAEFGAHEAAEPGQVELLQAARGGHVAVASRLLRAGAAADGISGATPRPAAPVCSPALPWTPCLPALPPLPALQGAGGPLRHRPRAFHSPSGSDATSLSSAVPAAIAAAVAAAKAAAGGPGSGEQSLPPSTLASAAAAAAEPNRAAVTFPGAWGTEEAGPSTPSSSAVLAAARRRQLTAAAAASASAAAAPLAAPSTPPPPPPPPLLSPATPLPPTTSWRPLAGEPLSAPPLLHPHAAARLRDPSRETPLLAACRAPPERSARGMVRLLLDHGAGVDEAGGTELALCGNGAAVVELLAARPGLRAHLGRALEVAASAGRAEAVAALLAAGADPLRSTHALSEAAYRGHVSVLRAVLDAPCSTALYGSTVVQRAYALALQWGRIEAADLLRPLLAPAAPADGAAASAAGSGAPAAA